MFYVPRHFKIQELVPPHVYQERGDRAWELLDPLLLESLDQIRDAFGPMLCNTWHNGGSRMYSGLRMPGDPHWSKYSQHSFGRAADLLPIAEITADKIRQYILSNPGHFPLITGVELDVSWLHIDVRNTLGVVTFRP